MIVVWSDFGKLQHRKTSDVRRCLLLIFASKVVVALAFVTVLLQPVVARLR